MHHGHRPGDFRGALRRATKPGFYFAVVVAVAAVGVVQMAAHQIIDVIAVRHRFMTAVRTVLMVRGVAAAFVIGRAGVAIGIAHLQAVFIHVAVVDVMQVTVVKKFRVAIVLQGRMATIGAVLVAVRT